MKTTRKNKLSEDVQAVILCSETPDTLAPLCETAPACSLRILGETLLERSVRTLSQLGFSRICACFGENNFASSALCERLKADYGITVSRGGSASPQAVRHCWLGGDMAVFQGNIARISEDEIIKLLRLHFEKNSPLTVSVKCKSHDCFEIGYNGENPPIFSFNGVYVLAAQTVGQLPLNTKISDLNELSRLTPNSVAVALNEITSVKTVEDLKAENLYALEKAASSSLTGILNLSGSQLQGVTLIPPVFVGKNSSVGRGAILCSGTVIEENVTVGEGCSIENSIVGEFSKIGAKTAIDGAFLDKMTTLGNSCRVMKNSVIGENTSVYHRCVIKSGARLSSGKKIPSDTTVTPETASAKEGRVYIDDEGKISGFCAEITPWLCSAAGAAAASAADRGENILIACGENGMAEDLAECAASGAAFAGAKVWRITRASMGEAVFAANITNSKIGIFVSDEFSASLKFFSGGGIKLREKTEAAIEENINFSLFRKASQTDYRRPVQADALKELYLSTLEEWLPEKFHRLNVTVKTNDRKIARICDKIIHGRNDISGENVIFHVNSAGEGISAYSEKTGYVFREKLALVAAAHHIKEGKNVALSETFPDVAENITSAFSGRIFRFGALTDEKEDSMAREIAAHNGTLFLCDPIALMVKILSLMQKNSCSLGQLTKEIPKFYTARRFVAVSDGNGEVSHRVVKSENNEAKAIVRPVKNGKGVMIFAQALKAETASSLCDDIEMRLKKGEK